MTPFVSAGEEFQALFARYAGNMRYSPRMWWEACGAGVCLMAAMAVPVSGQTNNWTKPTSGYWEELFWSSGVLPGSSQSICFTNRGYKALAIGGATALAFPEALTVSNLVVSAPNGSSNLLFLNYMGRSRPFQVRETLTVGRNGGLLSLASALEVGTLTRGQFLINGIVSQGDYSDVAAQLVWVGHEFPGVYQLSNGWFYANALLVGGTNYAGNVLFADFIQKDGASSLGRLSVQPHGGLTLDGGTLEALEVTVGEGFPHMGFDMFSTPPSMRQSGGSITVENDLVLGRGSFARGSYSMSGGSLTAERIRIGGNRYAAGTFAQDGGAVETGRLSISEEAYFPLALPESYTYSSYILSNGTLKTFASVIGAGRSGTFMQHGGEHVVMGDLHIASGTDWSRYVLTGGTVSSWTFNCDSARVSQTGGTNSVATSLALSGFSNYELSGGSLFSESTFINSVAFGPSASGFVQWEGLHIATNGMDIRSSYQLSGGELRTHELQLWGSFRHSGGRVAADTIVFNGGEWIAEVTNHEFGVTIFNPGTIRLPVGPSVLTFGRDVNIWAWSGIALTIDKWNGAIGGGGQHQVRLAPNVLPARGLTHIWFKDPVGRPAGLYPARMLPDGELVPTLNPTLAITDFGFQTVMSWGGDWVLQSATNVAGPYEDVSTGSPFTILSHDLPQQFFRLRR